nr:hypothetical protein [Pseudomonas viridiflava]
MLANIFLYLKIDVPNMISENVSLASDRIDVAILSVVRRFSSDRSRRLTFGQIYMEVLKRSAHVFPIIECVNAVDVLVREGLLISERTLDVDQSFPYTQHIISGLTEVGAASLSVPGSDSEPVQSGSLV